MFGKFAERALRRHHSLFSKTLLKAQFCIKIMVISSDIASVSFFNYKIESGKKNLISWKILENKLLT